MIFYILCCYSDGPDIVWTGIGKKIPVVIFYASLLESELRERVLLPGKVFVSIYTLCACVCCRLISTYLQDWENRLQNS